jgi:hypothetical protein
MLFMRLRVGVGGVRSDAYIKIKCHENFGSDCTKGVSWIFA